MIFIDEERPSDSPFVDRIWRSHSEGTAPFLSIAVSRCELVVTKMHGKITMMVRGPETKATPLGDSPSDGEWFGILLKLGTFLPHLPTRSLLDTGVTLPEATNNTFWLSGSAWEFPTYDNAEIFITGWCVPGYWFTIRSSRPPYRGSSKTSRHAPSNITSCRQPGSPRT